MSEQPSGDAPKPLRRQWIQRREDAARANGWAGPWPPEKPSVESAADCEHMLARLEAGEQRAGFLAALPSKLVAFFEHLQPAHFARFAVVLLDVAANSTTSHRSRLRAITAAIRPLRAALLILPKLEKAGDDSLQTHLESLLGAFCDELGAEDFGRLAALLVELAGPAAKTASDKLRATEAALRTVTDAMGMLATLRPLLKRRAQTVHRDYQGGTAEGERILADMEARITAEFEEERRTGKPARSD